MAINEVLAALADDTRRKILLKLQEGKISSGDLAISLDMTPQALSYHLSKLKKADLIYETRYKNYIYYELNYLSLMKQLCGSVICVEVNNEKENGRFL